MAAVHEVLGLTAYRTGKWKQAAAELEAAQALHPSVELLPVLADVYRAQWRVGRRRPDLDERCARSRPSQEVLAEARIVVAGAEADQGDLKAALRTMGDVTPAQAGARRPPPPVVRPRRSQRPRR